MLIVRPGSQKALYQTLNDNLTGIEPPWLSAALASYVRDKGFSVKIVDGVVEDAQKAILKEQTNLIAVVVSGTNPSASTSNMVGAREILLKIKEYGIPTRTILMGLHPSALPFRTLKEEPVDMVCQGEGFKTLEGLLSDESKTSIPGLWTDHIHNVPASLIDPDILPMPAWDLLPMEKYRCHNWQSFGDNKDRNHYGVVYTSFGCSFNCSFCNINAIFGKHTIRYRDPEKVIKEVDYLVDKFGVHYLKIMDEMFGLDEKHTMDICDLLIESGHELNIWAYSRVDSINEQKLRMMKQAGIRWLGIGYESGSSYVRGTVTKGKFDNERIFNVTKMVKDAGINIIGNFIFGLPGDDHSTMNETLNLSKKLNCEYVNFYSCMLYPGSLLYEEAHRDMVKEDWAEYSQLGYLTKPMGTPYASPESVLRFRDMAFGEYFSGKEYQDMVRVKFGDESVKQIQEMLNHKLKRKILGDKTI